MDDTLRELLDVGRRLAEERSLTELLDYALDVAVTMFEAEFGHIILSNGDGELEFISSRASGSVSAVPEVSRTIVDRVLLNGEEIVIDDALRDPTLTSSQSVALMRMRSVLCVALISHGERLGALYMENRSHPRIFTDENVLPLKIFAGQVATAIHNARLIENLETLIDARTAELRQLVNDLDAFSATVAHDLKSPLANVAGYAQLLAEMGETLAPAKRQRMLDTIYDSSIKMTRMIDDLLMLARVRESEDIPTGPLDMRRVVDEALRRFEPEIISSGAHVHITPDLPTAAGHPGWVEEVWANYISNALKYGGTPPLLQISADYEAPQGYVRFWVADNGPGLTEEQIEKLFVTFARLVGGEIEGQGLGLSIVRRVIMRLGGQVGAASEPGNGAQFWFTLPSAG